jgi:alkylhydroperoxidase/carboxymuconolactone decarboxylase family protein YurZ
VKFIAMTLASLSMVASSVAQADPEARDEVRAVAPALEKYRQDTLFGDLWKRPGLSPRDRSIVTLAALITRNQTAEMAQYLSLALDNGVKPSELSEGVGMPSRDFTSEDVFSSRMMSMHSSTHSSQMNTVGPAMSLRTSCWLLPQNEQ